MANKWEDLEITKEELKNIETALKNEEFRKLLIDYCEEINDPANKKKYQDEITQLEKERGNEVTFIEPTGGYVIKTSLNGSKLAFINVCSNENVNRPVSESVENNGQFGSNWSVPHLISPPREDLNKKSKRCTVYDVIFHPEALIFASRNKKFRELINNIACDAIESNYNVKLDKTNLKFPKMKFKGVSRPLVIRERIGEAPKLDLADPVDKIYSDIYDHLDSQKQQKPSQKIISEVKTKYATPKYVIKHRTSIELQDFTREKNSNENIAIPKELVIEINLPLLKNSSDLKLDVSEKSLSLISEKPAKYELFLSLPYTVLEEQGTAKFDQDGRQLTVTLPVLRRNLSLDNDSGVESDHILSNSNSFEENSPLVCELSDKFNFERNYEDVNKQNGCQNLEKNINVICDLKNGDNSEQNLVSDNKNSDKRTLVFLDPELHYILPEFSCHTFNDILVYTLRVKNVQNSSFVKVFPTGNSVHIKFCSLSPSFVPINYSVLLKFPLAKLDCDQFISEIWDNNLIVQCAFLDGAPSNYFIGSSEEDLEEKMVDEPSNVYKNLITKTSETFDERSEVKCEVMSTENNGIAILLSDSKISSSVDSLKICDDVKKLSHSYSESSCDELSISPTKGILKSRSRTLSRSVSESSVDDYTWSSFENFGAVNDSLIPEDLEVISSSMKKTVRFNDVVSKQLFRTNSSILGQKKKNQRKSRNKKRAQERRLSESENSEAEDKINKFLKKPTNPVINTEEVQNDIPNENPTDKTNDCHQKLTNDLIFDIDM